LLGLTGLDRVLFSWLIEAKPPIAEMAHRCYLLSAAVPFVDAAQAYVRGVLTAHHRTVSRLVAVLGAMIILIGVLLIGVTLKWSGPVLAATAVTSALLAELAVLSAAWSRAKTMTHAFATR
jgi:Na+-driven multidrug efflux pump